MRAPYFKGDTMFTTDKMMVSLGRFINKIDKKEKQLYKRYPNFAKKMNPVRAVVGGSLFSILFIFLVFILPQLLELLIFGEILPFDGR